MITRRSIVLTLLGLCVSAAALAHPMTHQGTVAAVESARLQVKTTDDKTKKESLEWFVVNADTRVMRGDKAVAYKDARIAVGERVVVTVDMDAKTKMLATEIHLPAVK